jgi:hypothetical protein
MQGAGVQGSGQQARHTQILPQPLQRSGLNVYPMQGNGVQANGGLRDNECKEQFVDAGETLTRAQLKDTTELAMKTKRDREEIPTTITNTHRKKRHVINDRHSGSKRALLDIVGDDLMTILTHQQTNHPSFYSVSQDTAQSERNQICELNSETWCSEPIVRRQNKKQRTEHQLMFDESETINEM